MSEIPEFPISRIKTQRTRLGWTAIPPPRYGLWMHMQEFMGTPGLSQQTPTFLQSLAQSAAQPEETSLNLTRTE